MKNIDNEFIKIMERIDNAFSIPRNPKRIAPFLDLLKEYWLLNPDLRFSQIYNIIEKAYGRDIYHVEEEDLMETLKRLIEKRKEREDK